YRIDGISLRAHRTYQMILRTMGLTIGYCAISLISHNWKAVLQALLSENDLHSGYIIVDTMRPPAASPAAHVSSFVPSPPPAGPRRTKVLSALNRCGGKRSPPQPPYDSPRSSNRRQASVLPASA